MWKNININIQNIVVETEKAILIKMPNNSEYKGYSFWHPSKLVRNGRHSYSVSIGYTNDFKFNLKKYGKGKWNSKDIIDEIEIDSEDFEKSFGIMDQNISSPNNDSYLKIYEPIKVDKKIEVKEELINE